MKKTVADGLWEMLIQAGVTRCYGIVGDALNPVVHALSRHREVEFVDVRHEEWGVFAASADSQLSGQIVAVCGTAGPGITHLLNGLIDARRERAKILVIAGDVETDVIDTEPLQGVNPYDLFRSAANWVGRAIHPAQATAVFDEALRVCQSESGPAVVAIPGNIAAAALPANHGPQLSLSSAPKLAAREEEVREIAQVINDARRVMIFGGDGCGQAADAVIEFAQKIAAPVGFSFKGKNWLEADNPNAVGMTGLLGYGGCHHALKRADLVILLGTDFPYPRFLSVGEAQFVQVDTVARHLGRRVPVRIGLNSDVGAFLEAVMPHVLAKTDHGFLDEALEVTASWRKRLHRYVDRATKRRSITPRLRRPLARTGSAVKTRGSSGRPSSRPSSTAKGRLCSTSLSIGSRWPSRPVCRLPQRKDS